MKIAALAALTALLLAGAASADPLTPAQNRAAVDQSLALVTKDYVFPEKRAAIVAEIKKHEAEGRYDIANPAQFAEVLADDMIAAAHDKHMWFRYDPDDYKALSAPKAENAPGGAARAYFDDTVGRENQGYGEMRILPGNVRYVKVTGFDWDGAPTRRAAADAARFLAGGDAIIIDISGNGGGSAEAVQALVSYLLPPDNRVLMTFHDALTNTSSTTRVLDKLEGPRLTGKPVYVLISNATGSAAEEFAYHIRNFHIGTLVGTTTGGAANNDTIFPIAPYFTQSISTGRTEHPVTHTNWQDTGVPPDIKAPPETALPVAEEAALKFLLANPAAPHRADYQWALEGAQAEMHPMVLDAAALAAFAGQYEGDRKIWIADGRVYYRRGDREPTTIIPLGDDLFAFRNTDASRLHFKREAGKIEGFDIVSDDGQSIPAKRTGD
jgi:hypothetical protein